MERTGKMILSAVFGALIGLIIAFAMNRLYWWVGLAAGGLAGYLSYEWRMVVRAAAEVVGSREKLLAIGKRSVLMLTVLCWTGGWAALIAYPIIYVFYTHASDFFPQLILFLAYLTCLAAGIAALFMAAGVFVASTGEIKKLERFILFSSSLIAIGAMLPYGIFLIARNGRKIGRAVGDSVWELLLLIHSEDRMIVGFSALLGTAGGYLARSFIVGALAAAACVAFLKHVVADRWLKPRGYIRTMS